jgi:hypothetical protein
MFRKDIQQIGESGNAGSTLCSGVTDPGRPGPIRLELWANKDCLLAASCEMPSCKVDQPVLVGTDIWSFGSLVVTLFGSLQIYQTFSPSDDWPLSQGSVIGVYRKTY